MSFVTCADCGKTLRDGRRYDLGPLAEFMRCSEHSAAVWAGLSGDTQRRARCHGITRQVADRISADLKAHPAEIWPEVVDHDIEDAQRPCEECGAPFVPSQPQQKFCTRTCGRRHRDREYQRRRYHSDPDHRDRKLATAAEYKQEARRAVNAQRRRWVAANLDTVQAKRRAHHEANKAFYNARRRARYQANRAAELETQRRYRERRRGQAA